MSKSRESSSPEPQTPAERMADAIRRLEANPMASPMAPEDQVPPGTTQITFVAPHRWITPSR